MIVLRPLSITSATTWERNPAPACSAADSRQRLERHSVRGPAGSCSRAVEADDRPAGAIYRGAPAHSGRGPGCGRITELGLHLTVDPAARSRRHNRYRHVLYSRPPDGADGGTPREPEGTPPPVRSEFQSVAVKAAAPFMSPPFGGVADGRGNPFSSRPWLRYQPTASGSRLPWPEGSARDGSRSAGVRIRHTSPRR